MGIEIWREKMVKSRGSMKEYNSTTSYPKLLSYIVLSVGFLAFFITFASWVLSSQPIGVAVRSYFYGVDDHVSASDSPVVWIKNKPDDQAQVLSTPGVNVTAPGAQGNPDDQPSAFGGNVTVPEVERDEKKQNSDSSSEEKGGIGSDLPGNTDSALDLELPSSNTSSSREYKADGSVDSGVPSKVNSIGGACSRGRAYSRDDACSRSGACSRDDTCSKGGVTKLSKL
ncbi:hypothetical protein AKJ16_DCAP27271 [Drosera capensis]